MPVLQEAYFPEHLTAALIILAAIAALAVLGVLWVRMRRGSSRKGLLRKKAGSPQRRRAHRDGYLMSLLNSFSGISRRPDELAASRLCADLSAAAASAAGQAYNRWKMLDERGDAEAEAAYQAACLLLAMAGYFYNVSVSAPSAERESGFAQLRSSLQAALGHAEGPPSAFLAELRSVQERGTSDGTMHRLALYCPP